MITNSTVKLDQLPESILLQVCGYLDKRDLNSLGNVSQVFDRITEDRTLWERSFCKNRIEPLQGTFKKTYLQFLRKSISYFSKAINEFLN